MGDLTQADPVPFVLAKLRAHPRIIAEFGGPDHVSGLSEAPWNHLVVTDGPGGTLHDLMWDVQREVTLEVHGHPNGSPGKTETKRLLMVAMLCVKELDQVEYLPGDPVVADVSPTGVLAWSPMLNGQPRVIGGLLITLHPPVG